MYCRRYPPTGGGDRTLTLLGGESFLYPGRGGDGLKILTINLVDTVLRNAPQTVQVYKEGDFVLDVADRYRRIHLPVLINVGLVLDEGTTHTVGVGRLGLYLADRRIGPPEPWPL